MAPSRSRPAVDDPHEQARREQEVLRANRELQAYFKGQRTEREARAALKTIKAFIRDRERTDPVARRPWPPAASGKPAARGRLRAIATVRNIAEQQDERRRQTGRSEVSGGAPGTPRAAGAVPDPAND